MLLATRCPFCETVFRLQPAQLSLRRGLVRCGHCQEVFDASSSLYETADEADFSTATPISASTAATLVAGPQPFSLDFSAEAWNPWAPAPDVRFDDRLRHSVDNVPLASVAAGVAVTPRQPEVVPRARAEAQAFEPELRETHEEPAFTHAPEPAMPDNEPMLHPVSPVIEEPVADEWPTVWRPISRTSEDPTLHRTLEPTPYTSIDEPHLHRSGEPAVAAAAEPFTVHPPIDPVNPFPVVREIREMPPMHRGRMMAGIAIAVLLLITLLAQIAWWQREMVMVFWPGAQDAYRTVCAPLGCRITPPHDIDGLQVEPSDLRQVDGAHKLELKMPLRNRFNVALAYPAIELTLLDAQNNVAIRRVLWPQDYVTPGTSIPAGLPPRTTQTMIVRLDTGPVVASNFRVQIFYP
ncbi:DUF3426 domain-containing protein [Paraburkholderia sp.]|uniref:zinc-ribbon and DUF3426 domain-containing protein n=1 Tax=Paraburkholderia sp. TaxID=1926495 RepID=UPI0023A1C3D8|nr:DUF3426 domain-containing protein [Paraburkholderia sp.]MDE1183257.1 DUF3426 domain-containing protein [Paraburkholderia sp.]